MEPLLWQPLCLPSWQMYSEEVEVWRGWWSSCCCSRFSFLPACFRWSSVLLHSLSPVMDSKPCWISSTANRLRRSWSSILFLKSLLLFIPNDQNTLKGKKPVENEIKKMARQNPERVFHQSAFSTTQPLWNPAESERVPFLNAFGLLFFFLPGHFFLWECVEGFFF